MVPPIPAPGGEHGTEAYVPPALKGHERYQVVRLLGTGGMGAVYEALHLVMQRPVALKVIKRAYTADLTAVERFRREVRAAARLSHPNIVAAYDAENVGDTHFLVMEFVAEKSLASVLKEHGPLPVALACEYIRQAALGLQHAHERGMVHRDVKPDNLMLTADGTVKVLDFGLATLLVDGGAEGLTGTSVIMGTPDYMAPEQAEDAHKADSRADVYSLGCTLYHLLAGEIPYPAPTSLLKILAHREQPVPPVRRKRPDVPEGLARVLARMLAKNPKDRYQTAGEVAAALVPFTQVVKTPPRKKRRAVSVLAAVLFIGVVIAGAAVYHIQTGKGELVITTESDDVKVVITRGGKLVDVIDTKTDKQIRLALRSGEYDLELKGAPEGLKLNIDKVTLKRGEQTLAKIEYVAKVSEISEIRSFGRDNPRIVRMALSPDGQKLLTGRSDGEATYWDIRTGKEIHRLRRKDGQVYGVAFSPDGKKLLTSGSVDTQIYVWDASTGKELKRLPGHTGQVACLAVSPDGRMVASAAWERHGLGLWNLDTGKLMTWLGDHPGGLNCVAISPDGKQIATGGLDGKVWLWDVKNRKEVHCLIGHTERVTAVAFSRDGNRLLSGSDAGAGPGFLRLWEVRTGKQLLTIDQAYGGVVGLAISADGRRALSGGSAGLVYLWDLESGKKISAFKDPPFVCGVAFLPRGRTAVAVVEHPERSVRPIRLLRLPDLSSRKDKP
jgi:hypothetical protein